MTKTLITANEVTVNLSPTLAERLDQIRERYGFERDEMIRLMIQNYPQTVTPEALAAAKNRTPDPIEPHALAQIELTLEEAHRKLNRAQAAASDWRRTLNERAALNGEAE